MQGPIRCKYNRKMVVYSGSLEFKYSDKCHFLANVARLTSSPVGYMLHTQQLRGWDRVLDLVDRPSVSTIILLWGKFLFPYKMTSCCPCKWSHHRSTVTHNQTVVVVLPDCRVQSLSQARILGILDSGERIWITELSVFPHLRKIRT